MSRNDSYVYLHRSKDPAQATNAWPSLSLKISVFVHRYMSVFLANYQASGYYIYIACNVIDKHRIIVRYPFFSCSFWSWLSVNLFFDTTIDIAASICKQECYNRIQIAIAQLSTYYAQFYVSSAYVDTSRPLHNDLTSKNSGSNSSSN